ncbi:peroxidase family protein [Mesorhizobium sp. IMUNJ 23232]|uniref:peroxidase family protein n=1 Tax=Mesorhizobium sp. IMUNJ 23232 TaxID=3376064 RepID=UPI00378E1836
MIYVVDGEPIVNKDANPSDRFLDTQEPLDSPFRFTRMFEEQREQPPDHLLRCLGEKMARDTSDAQLDGPIPAGYTYLGQFIAHEITHNGSEYKKALQNIEQLTSPSVNLGSLYGDKLYLGDEDTSYYLEIGQTKLDDINVELPQFLNDLPRTDGQPKINEKRNDNNLNLAQIHVAMIRFHNAVASRLSQSGEVSAKKIRKTVIQHFQSVVLNDFLRKVVNEYVYSDVIEHGPTFYRPARSPENPYPAMPLEFAMAAFRFGHSMVRSKYTPAWNGYHHPGLDTLLRQTNNVGGIDQLQSSWVANWSRLFDFRELGITVEQPLFARRIDTRIARALGDLPAGALPAPAPSANLPIRTLLFGAAARLPSGEAASRQMNCALSRARRRIEPIPVLSEDEITADEDEDVRCILEDPRMRGNTPLWFYILKEAQLRECGERLGPLGGRIVMEVLYELIANSDYSILQEKNWRPSLPFRSGKEGYVMTDLLALAGDIDPFPQPICA